MLTKQNLNENRRSCVQLLQIITLNFPQMSNQVIKISNLYVGTKRFLHSLFSVPQAYSLNSSSNTCYSNLAVHATFQIMAALYKHFEQKQQRQNGINLGSTSTFFLLFLLSQANITIFNVPHSAADDQLNFDFKEWKNEYHFKANQLPNSGCEYSKATTHKVPNLCTFFC
ncbi:CLUMA_CG012912, isoform A [Clunio marinus]|uniref:CLUMA_CG012912, isoform A n=1 Tax=Clunio marinus TaxID=568069 RepID=A0A1J1IHC2_9DIPT|nr:CLUMA_CG012912, isoform A [Clunio marinus]